MNAFIDEWDMEQRRLSRIEEQRSAMPPHQLKRLERFERETQLGLARVYGNRLNQQVAARIVESIVLDPACLCTVGGGPNEMPTTPAGWDDYARAQAEREPLAQLSIDASDAALKERIRREARDALPPARRMAMARSGELDGFLDDLVREKLQERAGV